LVHHEYNSEAQANLFTKPNYIVTIHTIKSTYSLMIKLYFLNTICHDSNMF